MIRTRAELAAQLLRAARGAGQPLGVAEDLYAAAPFLTAEDTAWLTRALTQGGATLSDLQTNLDAVESGQQSAALPATARALAAARGWTLSQGAKDPTPPTKSKDPIEIPDPIWVELTRLAARTYVPDTASSRAQGAGAGNIDTD